MPAAINLARDTSPSLSCSTEPALQLRPLSQHEECFQLFGGGLAAHLLGNGLIHGLDIQTLLLSWQWGLRVLWQHLPRMHKEVCSLLSAIIDLGTGCKK
jgi:hypothetical protein